MGCKKMAGVDRIYMPGEIEQLTEARRREEGIPYVEAEVSALNTEAERVGVEGAGHALPVSRIDVVVEEMVKLARRG